LKEGKLVLTQVFEGLGGGEAVSALTYTIGEQSVVVGGDKGTLCSYTLLEKADRNKYVRAHELQSLGQRVEGFSVSLRDRPSYQDLPKRVLKGHFGWGSCTPYSAP